MSAHGAGEDEAQTPKQNESHCESETFGATVRSGLIFLAEFSIIAPASPRRLCQIIASFLHFFFPFFSFFFCTPRKNESIPWEPSSRAGLSNPGRRTLLPRPWLPEQRFGPIGSHARFGRVHTALTGTPPPAPAWGGGAPAWFAALGLPLLLSPRRATCR